MQTSKQTKINNELGEYIETFNKSGPKNLKALEESFGLPDSHIQVSFAEGAFLNFLIQILKAKNVLEIGTFRGFSSTFLAKSLPKEGKLITIEFDKRNWPEAKKLWKKMKLSKKIEQREGEAIKVLKDLQKEKKFFDFIFIDADKRNYKEYFLQSIKLLNKGGVIAVDNVLWRGKIVEKDIKRESLKFTKEFNDFVSQKFKGKVCLLPAWDGVIFFLKI